MFGFDSLDFLLPAGPDKAKLGSKIDDESKTSSSISLRRHFRTHDLRYRARRKYYAFHPFS